MNSSFIIQPAKLITESADLYIKIKPHGLSYIVLENNVCMTLAIYHFKAGATDEKAVSFIHQVMVEQPVLLQKFNKVYIIYGYEQTILVPHRFFTGEDNKAMLELVFGDTRESVISTDFMYQQGIHNVYSVPAIIHSVMLRYFSSAIFNHLFSLLPQVVNGGGSHLYCIFNTGQLTLLLQKEGRLQAMQNYSYKTPEDAAYHLLNLCRSFETDINSTTVHLSGMIDAASSLYAELYKYFGNLFFEALPEEFEYPEQIGKYPSHYFSHLFAIAKCV
ncbi:MAG: DUF3822 family protein [Ferruginibacter sp.]